MRKMSLKKSRTECSAGQMASILFLEIAMLSSDPHSGPISFFFSCTVLTKSFFFLSVFVLYSDALTPGALLTLGGTALPTVSQFLVNHLSVSMLCKSKWSNPEPPAPAPFFIELLYLESLCTCPNRPRVKYQLTRSPLCPKACWNYSN